MKAAMIIFWKEIRENAKWAASGAAALAIGLVYGAYHAIVVNSRPGVSDIGAVWSEFNALWNGTNMTLALGAPLIGLALGCLQILPERVRDRWAFFIHRPAERFALFAGKIAAGITLLLMATAIPLIGMALWIRMPGHVAAPFDWRMTESGFQSIVDGIVFYFAGVLVAVRPARWYGSRLMPIPTAIMCAMIGSGTVKEFWQALATAGVFAIVLGLATWDSFRRASGNQAVRRLGHFCLSLTLAFGIAASALTIVAVLVNARQIFGPRIRFADFAWSTVQTTDEGQIVRPRLRTFSSEVIGLADLNGQTLNVGSPSDWVKKHPLYDMHDLDAQSAFAPGSRRYNDVARYATVVNPYQYPYRYGFTHEPEIRYLFHNLILVYSIRTGTLVGAVGRNGYRAAHSLDEAAAAGPFDLNPKANVDQPTTVVADRGAIYSIGVESVKPILSGISAGKEPSVTMAYFSVRKQFIEWTVISTANSIFIFDANRKLSLAIPRSYDSRIYNHVAVAETGAGRLVFLYQHQGAASRIPPPSYVVVYNNSGKRLTGYSIASLPSPVLHSRPTDSIVAPLAGIGVPFAVDAVAAIDALVNSDVRSPRQFLLLLAAIPGCIPLVLGSAIAGLISALVTWRIARRCAFGRGLTWPWVVGNVFLSWIGVLLLVALRPLPVREQCESCGHQRVVTRDTCEHCGVSWPDVRRDGTEIVDNDGGRLRLAV